MKFTDPARPVRKILVIKLRAMGDTVIMTAALNELRRIYRKAEIHVMVTSPWAPLLEHHPGVDRVWHYHRRKDMTARAKTLARLAIELRREHYDLVLNFHASPSSSTLAFATGAKTRAVHFHGHTDKNRYSTVEIPGKGEIKPAVERDMDVVRALGAQIPEGRVPQVYLTDAEIDKGAEYLEHHQLNGPVLGIGLGASRPTKVWPVDRYAALATAWSQQTGGSAVALAGPDENQLIVDFLKAVDDQVATSSDDSEAKKAVRGRISFFDNLPVRHLAGVLANCAVFAGNDSGPKHLSIALGTPTVTLMGPEHPFEWHPYPTDLHPYLFVENLECRRDAAPGMPPWCGLYTCVEEQHKCMRLISVDQVLSECKRIAEPSMMGKGNGKNSDFSTDYHA